MILMGIENFGGLFEIASTTE